MKKRFLALVGLLVVAGTAQLFAWGIGVQGGASVGGAGGAAVTFKLDESPLVFAVDASFYSNYIGIGATADYWIQNPEVMDVSFGSWKWYYGVGLAAGVGLGDNYFTFSVAPRALVGTNLFIMDNFLEFYTQLAYQPTLSIGDYGGFALINFPIVGGVRFWF